MSYVDEVYDRVVRENPSQPEFHQAVREVLDSLRPVIERNEEKYRREALLERITMPERQLLFRVPWVDDKGQVQVNNAFRDRLQDAGLVISGVSPDGRLTEMIELPDHPWFVASQGHPEFKSRPTRPHPLFSAFVHAAAIGKYRG